MTTEFHYIVQTEDDLKCRAEKEIIVIATDAPEALEELKSYFSMHGEIVEWSIKETVKETKLDAGSPFAKDYSDKGAHSYID